MRPTVARQSVADRPTASPLARPPRPQTPSQPTSPDARRGRGKPSATPLRPSRHVAGRPVPARRAVCYIQSPRVLGATATVNGTAVSVGVGNGGDGGCRTHCVSLWRPWGRRRRRRTLSDSGRVSQPAVTAFATAATTVHVVAIVTVPTVAIVSDTAEATARILVSAIQVPRRPLVDQDIEGPWLILSASAANAVAVKRGRNVAIPGGHGAAKSHLPRHRHCPPRARGALSRRKPLRAAPARHPSRSSIRHRARGGAGTNAAAAAGTVAVAAVAVPVNVWSGHTAAAGASASTSTTTVDANVTVDGGASNARPRGGVAAVEAPTTTTAAAVRAGAPPA